MTVKPGFVRTRMTDGMNLPTWLTASPEEAADAIVRAIYRRHDAVYVHRIWRLIMLIVCTIPDGIFKRLRAFPKARAMNDEAVRTSIATANVADRNEHDG